MQTKNELDILIPVFNENDVIIDKRFGVWLQPASTLPINSKFQLHANKRNTLTEYE